MPSQVISSVENNFTKGLVTEFTGLNFPENAATDTDNCEYTVIGDVIRREGINFENNAAFQNIDRTNKAITTYVWDNVGGDGLTKWVVKQIGKNLTFYDITNVSTSSSVSANSLSFTVDLSTHTAFGTAMNETVEAEYASANGYLFVFHPNIEPVYITYNSGTNTISTTQINIQIRDFQGINDGLAVNTRPASLSNDHLYNLLNQGWVTGQPWSATSSTPYPPGTLGSSTWTVAAGITGIVAGQLVSITYNGPQTGTSPPPGTKIASGTVTGYSGTTLTINITSATTQYPGIVSSGPWTFTPISIGFINSFFTAANVYPSNADVWWYFRDNTGAFNPGTTLANVSLTSGNAPQGHFIFSAFLQDRSATSGQPGITPVFTTVRPSTGAWFAGRVWFTGVNASFPAGSDVYSTAWSENIYFSQTITSTPNFGDCYQVNDPTGADLNGLLPTDGGVITIQGCGRIFKLFPIANGLLVFTSNGVWFITGSQGIGFAANDYTITKISSVKALSSQSFVDVLGLPYFWNEEGIYQVMQGPSGQLGVEPLTVGSILSYYNEIPLISKFFARGAYNPIDYVIQWTYNGNVATTATDRYEFNKILNFNTYNKAFFPYTISTDVPGSFIHGINYIDYPVVNPNTPPPSFKYIASQPSGGSYNFSFAEEYDTAYIDWGSSNYDSYFVTGYKLHGQGQRRFQVPYVYVYSNTEVVPNGYKIQSQWDYATSGSTGRWSSYQIVNNADYNYSRKIKRHRLRGNGLVMQIKITSVDGLPFDINGWSVYENLNQGV
jgi:hypothetical protein